MEQTATRSVAHFAAKFCYGNWKTPFDTIYTANRDFYVNRETTIKVPSMYMKGKRFKYGESASLKSKLLKLPYKGGEASMVIVLPDDIEGLHSVLQQLTAGHDLMADIKDMEKTKIDITIPKFKAKLTIDLKNLLPELGVNSIFDSETSDIDMLTSNRRLFVSKAIQKASQLTFWCTSSMDNYCEPDTFEANRPFLYLLTCHEIPIFIGVYKGSEYAHTAVL